MERFEGGNFQGGLKGEQSGFTFLSHISYCNYILVKIKINAAMDLFLQNHLQANYKHTANLSQTD